MDIRKLFLAGASLAAMTAVPAYAQSEPVSSSTQAGVANDDDEIIVTAQRRAESINDVGMAVQAFEADTLQDLRITSVRDLTTVAPSFTVSQSYQGVPTYTLRGIGFNTINLSATSTVGTYVDEAAYAYPIMNTGPLMDLERVEVLKGPQGTLYGRNSTAGLINFITAKPTSEFEGGVSADLGNYQTYNVGGYLSGPLGDNIQARIAFRSENSDKGWQVDQSSGDQLGKVDKWGLRASLAIQPTPTTEFNVSFTYWRNKSDTLAAQGIGFTPATNPTTGTSNSRFFNAVGLAAYIANNQPDNARDAGWAPTAARSADIGTGLGLSGPLAENSKFAGVKFRLDQELTDSVKLVSIFNYNNFRRKALSDWSGVPYEILLQRVNGEITSWAEDFHIEGETGPVNWLVGGYYAHDTILDSNRTMLGQNANVGLIRAAGAPLLATPFNSGGYTAAQLSQAFRTYEDVGNITTKTWSIFANADWKLSDQFKLNAGIRYTEDLQRYVGCSRDFNGNMLPNVNVVNRALYFQTYGVMANPISQGQCNTFNPTTGQFGLVQSVLDENNVAWRVSLDYTPSSDTLVYASVSRGAKAGTTPINAANLSRQNAPVRQEILTAYEMGLKQALGLAQLNLSAFYYHYKDKQISTYFADPIYTALSRLDNVPKSRAYGVEGDLSIRPTDGLTLALNALWLKTEINDYLGTNAAGQAQLFDGIEFIYSPAFQGSASLIYDTPISNNVNLQFTANGRYQSASNSIFEDLPLYKIPAYGVVNGSIGVHHPDDKWSVSLWVRNLFDKYYWTAVASNANVVVRFPSPPRTMGLTASFNF